jgi:hypothetical protein
MEEGSDNLERICQELTRVLASLTPEELTGLSLDGFSVAALKEGWLETIRGQYVYTPKERLECATKYLSGINSELAEFRALKAQMVDLEARKILPSQLLARFVTLPPHWRAFVRGHFPRGDEMETDNQLFFSFGEINASILKAKKKNKPLTEDLIHILSTFGAYLQDAEKAQ